MKTLLLKLRSSVIKFILRYILLRGYRIKALGVEQIPASGGVLLLGNHLSYLDWGVLLLTCPRPVYFVLAREIYRLWPLQLFFKLFDHVIPISSAGSKSAIHATRKHLMAGEVVVMFPEGYISRNGQMAALQKGYEKVIQEISVVIVPFYLLGLWGMVGSFALPWSRKLKRQQGRYINIVYGAPLSASTSAATIKQAIFKLSIPAWQQFTPCQHSIAYQWLLANKKMPRRLALADVTGVALSSLRLLVGVRFLQRQFKPLLCTQTHVGIILPLSAGGVLTNLALFCLGKVVINLNYTSGEVALSHAVSSANIKTIITSRQFIKRLNERGFTLDVVLASTTTIYLEDVRKASNKARLMLDLIYCKLTPFSWLAKTMLAPSSPETTTVILFSSGSEGKPKGIELTQQNIVTNVLQVLHVVNLRQDDVLLSTLPLFHAFGLTVNMLTPLFAGVPFVCQSDPTDGIAAGKLAYKYQATILTGTATFLNLYCRQRKLHPGFMQSLRLVIAGAEKVNVRIREAFKIKFGLTIYEGYGATETSPVVSVCLPDVINAKDWHIQIANKEGSVGLPLPGTAFRIVDPNTLQDLPCQQEGLILLGGPQVKRGYLNDPQRSAEVIINEEGIRWYKTGDKGRIDEDGFLYIIDRYSRFAKIGGEMVSLTAVEEAVFSILMADDEVEVMAVAVPNDKKGESIILFYWASISESELSALLKRSAILNIMLPDKIIKLQNLPKLGSGKNDYQAGKSLALNVSNH